MGDNRDNRDNDDKDKTKRLKAVTAADSMVDSMQSRFGKVGCGFFAMVALAVLALFVISGSVVTVDAGHVGVLTQFGAPTNTTYDPGLHFKLPVMQSVEMFDGRIQKEQVEAAAASRDLQSVKSTIAVNFQLDTTKASDVYQTIGTDYKFKVIDPAIQEAFKRATAVYTAEELITKREEVKNLAEKNLSAALEKFYVRIDAFNIVNFDFSEAYNEAIEAKQVASQNVLKAQQELAQRQIDAQKEVVDAAAQYTATVKLAEAQAESQRLQQQSLTQIYLQKLWIDKWDGKLPVYQPSQGEAGPLPILSIPVQPAATPAP
jgi:regulator of protease activity HflC (stomatin/prohibitin superfamily)